MKETVTFKRLFFLLLVCFWGIPNLWAQPMEVANSAPLTPLNLVTNVFLGEGVEVIDVQFEGQNNAVGYFQNADDEIGIGRGLVMSTGNASTQSGPVGVESVGSTQSSSATSGTSVSDPDLATIANGLGINDVVKYTITFIPISDTLRFNYVFGSEEYPEYVCSDFNDIFGFFISGPGINGPYQNGAENIALIPGTDLPVRINNVNPGVVGANGTLNNCTPPNGSLDFSAFYNANTGTSNQPVFDGFTDVFTAEAVVMPCSTYTIKLVIADVSDGGWDSGVFLEAKSFGTGSLDVEAVTLSLDGSVAEGCAEGLLNFVLPLPVESDYPIDYTILGTAENGVDYQFIPPDLFIPAGDSLVSIPIIAFEDGLMEGTETIMIDIQRDPCNRDTIIIPIKDNPLIPPELRPDTVICQGDTVQLDGTLDVPVPEPLTFYNDHAVTVSPAQTAIYSDIDVFGVIPANLGPSSIISVCIEDLQTTWADDLKIYLFSPGGQFMEMVTDIGNPGDNFIGTCFTPSATNLITDVTIADQPFTGEFAPEGYWEDLYGSDSPTNGTWQLSLFDKFAADVPVLNSWSITFRPTYEISYSWSPTAGLSCTDCPDPQAAPDVTTTYILTASDSYGCITMDTVTIEVIPDLEAPDAICSIITESSITISWPDVAGANSYEVNVDNMGWGPTNGMNDHIVNGLPLSTPVSFMIRAVGQCPGAIDTLVCATPDCTPPSLDIISTTDVSCYSGSDGTATLSAMGGFPPYTYTVDGQTNATGIFNNLAAGNYMAQVLDSTGCPQSALLVIDEPDSLDATLVKEDVTCFNYSDGTATYEITGGAGPYQFNWNNGQQADSIATGLLAGMHTLEVTDANGCVYDYTVEITQPDELLATSAVDSVDCNGDNTGAVTIDVEGGVEPYSYSFTPAVTPGASDNEAIDLARGTYSYTVTDANLCTYESGFEVEEPEELTMQITPVAALCADSASGNATVIVAGGVEPYSYSWQDNTMTEVSTDDNAPNLLAGNYTLEVTDANGCIISDGFAITEPTALNYMINTEEASCDGLLDGTATITPQGGIGGYTYNWSDIGAGPDSRNDLGSGTYDVTITDDNGCNLPITFDITSPEAVVLAFDSTATSCYQGTDGTATAIPSGGTSPYTYLWEDSQVTQTAVGLPGGIIDVTVTDDNGCEAYGSVNVEEATELNISLDGTDVSCFEGADGTITATGTGGTETYTFLWNDSQGQTTATATSLSAGMYTVTMTDNNNCEITADYVITEPTALSSTTDSEAATCNPDPDGTATVNASGGTPPYDYLWSDGQTVPIAQALTAGTYYVTITDDNDCTLIDTVEVDGIPMIVLDASSEDVSCNGGNDGQGSIIAVGGSGVYEYDWGAGLPDSPTQTSLSANDYVVTVTDELGCTETITVSVDEPAALTLSTDTEMIRCSGGSDGSAEVLISGGTAPYSVSWSNGDIGNMADSLGLGTYTVTVEDDNGCIESTSVLIEEASPISVTIEVEEVDCYGDRTGSARLLVSGGLPSYTYSWSNGSTAHEIQDVPAGDYTVLITDAAGCEVMEEIYVPQPDEPLEAAITAVDVSCYGEQDGRIIIDATGGTPGYRYSIDGNFFSGSSTFLGLSAGAYGVLVEDANGCILLLDAVEVEEPDPIIVDLGEDRSINFGDTIRLNPEITGGVGAFGYDWFPQDSSIMNCFECSAPLIYVDFQVSFKVIVTDETGCEGEDIVTIYAKKNRPILVPTGFSPNGDNQNDVLMVHARNDIEMNITSYRIFDRWGEQVFEATDFQPNDPVYGWDGTFRGEAVNAGVFIWHVEVEYIDGLKEEFKGHTTLIR